jgi:hypothetical protein
MTTTDTWARLGPNRVGNVEAGPVPSPSFFGNGVESTTGAVAE